MTDDINFFTIQGDLYFTDDIVLEALLLSHLEQMESSNESVLKYAYVEGKTRLPADQTKGTCRFQLGDGNYTFFAYSQ